MEEILSCIATARAVVALISSYILSSTPLADQSAVLIQQLSGRLKVYSRLPRITVMRRGPIAPQCSHAHQITVVASTLRSMSLCDRIVQFPRPDSLEILLICPRLVIETDVLLQAS
jgi:hypothetical protein